MASKYDPLFEVLVQASRDTAIGDTFPTTFSRIEIIIDDTLPRSARKRRGWWTNDESHPQAKAWLRAGWKVAVVKMRSGQILFERHLGIKSS